MYLSPCPCALEVRAAACDLLNRLVAFAITLNAAAFKAHHNVSGRSFDADHALFKDTYEAADDWRDALAERVSKLGGIAVDTLEEALPLSEMVPFQTGLTDGSALASELAARVLEFNRRIYEASARCEAADLVADVSHLGTLAEGVETIGWRLGKTCA